jgi:hypothetical protein
MLLLYEMESGQRWFHFGNIFMFDSPFIEPEPVVWRIRQRRRFYQIMSVLRNAEVAWS